MLDSISQFSAIKQENTTLKQQIGELSQSVTALKAALEQQDGDFSRRQQATAVRAMPFWPTANSSTD
ncbi:hypothetical protein [Dickeya solani]|uniref:hypothetical protein n=1 Tax=Dickeya solani TaxID=1089444 RepID=UPI0021DB411B|nr:hypothetical protein [Dickeya solani]